MSNKLPKKINITRVRGDTRRRTFHLTKSDGTDENISSWTAITQTVDPSEFPVNAAANIFAATGALVAGGTTGRFSIAPPGNSAIGNYYHDIQALDQNGEKITLVKGAYCIVQDIGKS